MRTQSLTRWFWVGLLGLGLTMGCGIPAQASCSYIPDYSTQEYRPIPAVTPAPGDLAPSSDAPSLSEDSAPESRDSVPLSGKDQGNWLQRLWRNLFG